MPRQCILARRRSAAGAVRRAERCRRERGRGDRGTIRYGVIDGDGMGREHVRNLALLDGAAVAAVADPFEPSRSAAHRLAGPGAAAFPDHRDLLADPSLDAVVIATPNHTHAATLEDALPADKAILVEKPHCTTVEDCRRMEATARRGGNLVTSLTSDRAYFVNGTMIEIDGDQKKPLMDRSRDRR